MVWGWGHLCGWKTVIYTRLTMNDAFSQKDVDPWLFTAFLVEFRRWIKALQSLFISGPSCPRWERWRAEALSFFPSSKTLKRKFTRFYVCNNFSFLAHAASFFHSNDFDVSPVGHDDISLADMYRWKVSAYAPCSSTCTSGKFGFRWPCEDLLCCWWKEHWYSLKWQVEFQLQWALQ